MRESLEAQVTNLLNKMSNRSPFKIKNISGGANNKVYKIETGVGDYLFKAYYHGPEDKRDRLKTEFGFSDFLWCNGIHKIPRPIVQDLENKSALYEYVDGRKVTQEEVDENLLSEVADFFVEINNLRRSREANQLPPASEACFSINEHITMLERRLEKLSEIESVSDLHNSAGSFIREELIPYWRDLKEELVVNITLRGLEIGKRLPMKDRCISPSDFGFHNALLTDEGGLKFFDFEYAGWDDPAKLVCDFFCQPEIPVSISHFEYVATAVSGLFEDEHSHIFQMMLLLPVYRLKWCTILLNDFLYAGNNRREFADSGVESEERKESQLAKAKSYFESIRLDVEGENIAVR